MSFQQAQLDIETRFAVAFTSTVSVKYQNVNFRPTSGQTYAELQIFDTATIRASLGTPALHRTHGLIRVNIFTTLNSGTTTGRALADAAAAIFRDATFSGIVCRSPRVLNVGEAEGWWVTSMIVEFYRDES